MSSTRTSAGDSPVDSRLESAVNSRPSTAGATASAGGQPLSRAARATIPPQGVYARELTKTFGDHEVIKSLDLHVEPGTIVGLIGPSGCGKTTTVRLLTGLLHPTSGVAAVSGTPSHELTSRERARIGYLPQTPALFPDLSLAENLSFHASMYGLPFRRRRRLNELLDWVELGEHRSKRVSDSSGGMQRRLSLAATFVHDPEVVFLDEPTAGIDPILRDKFWGRFRELAAQGKTLVITTQYVGEASECDLVGLLSDGEMLLLDTPANLRKAAFEGEVLDVTFTEPVSDEALARLADFDFVIGTPDRIDARSARVVVDDADTAMADLRPALDSLGLRVDEIAEHDVDYDEAFVQIVERHRSGLAASTAEGDDESIDGERDGIADGQHDDDGSNLESSDDLIDSQTEANASGVPHVNRADVDRLDVDGVDGVDLDRVDVDTANSGVTSSDDLSDAGEQNEVGERQQPLPPPLTDPPSPLSAPPSAEQRSAGQQDALVPDPRLEQRPANERRRDVGAE